jgi:hypothetical protein
LREYDFAKTEKLVSGRGSEKRGREEGGGWRETRRRMEGEGGGGKGGKGREGGSEGEGEGKGGKGRGKKESYIPVVSEEARAKGGASKKSGELLLNLTESLPPSTFPSASFPSRTFSLPASPPSSFGEGSVPSLSELSVGGEISVRGLVFREEFFEEFLEEFFEEFRDKVRGELRGLVRGDNRVLKAASITFSVLEFRRRTSEEEFCKLPGDSGDGVFGVFGVSGCGYLEGIILGESRDRLPEESREILRRGWDS